MLIQDENAIVSDFPAKDLAEAGEDLAEVLLEWKSSSNQVMRLMFKFSDFNKSIFWKMR